VVNGRPAGNLNNAERLAMALYRHGVREIFGQSIPVSLMQVAPRHGIRQIGYRAENAGGIMADGYARISGRIGVVAAQNGPAATLLVPPLAEALKSSIPVLALVEEIPASDEQRNAFQEFDHHALFQSCTKWIGRLSCGERLEDFVDLAMTHALSGRPGPVVLLLPRDVMSETETSVPRDTRLGGFPLDRTAPDPAAIAQAARLIAQAQRPFVLAGGGVHISGASETLVSLCERFALPVATSNMGKGAIAEDHPLSLGVFGNCMAEGTVAHELRPFAIEADLVLLVGTRTSQNATDGWTLLPRDVPCLHIDIDSVEIGRNYPALRLAGDARLALEAIEAALGKEALAFEPDQRRARIGEETAAARATAAGKAARAGAGRQGAVRPEALMRALDARLQPDDILVADASYSSNWMNSFLHARRTGQRFLTPRGLAGLGWGLPMAMGAKVAAPGSRVIAMVGDGGFGHCWSELETMRRMGIDVRVVVFNNAILGYQTHGENAFFGQHSDACELTPVDHAGIAKMCGLNGLTLSDPGQIDAAIGVLLGDQGPVLLDVMTDPEAHPPLSQFVGRETRGPVVGTD
jgi:acetolactate synthase-1/2/3 large subunit